MLFIRSLINIHRYYCHFLQPIRLPRRNCVRLLRVRPKYDGTRYNYGPLDILYTVQWTSTKITTTRESALINGGRQIPSESACPSAGQYAIKKSLLCLVGGCQRCVGTVGRVEQDGIWNKMKRAKLSSKYFRVEENN